ncbi:MAG TPA: serine hydrolase [Chitinophagaceae bacterium]|nr:serine hydrolase [Chitinophagaceae bacterium]
MKTCTFFLFLAISFSTSAQLYYPDTVWQKRSAADLKMNAALVDSAVKFAIANETKTDYDLRTAIIKSYSREPGYKIFGPVRSRGKASGLIVKNGYIIAEWGDPERVDMTFSVTKSYLSTVAGLAVDQRLIRTIDDRVGNYVWDDKYISDHNTKITWRHLLNQSSDWSGCLFDFCDWADRPPTEGTVEDWKNRKLVEPGTRFEYNDIRVNLLAYSLLWVWRKPLPQVLKEMIMDPIGASTTWRWYGYDNSFVNMDGVMVQSVSGGGHFGGGLFINSYDHARFGLLFCRNGKWNNNQLISPYWINAAREPSEPNRTYGLMWWLNTTNRLPSLSDRIYYADGYGGNYIIVDEEHDLVIVTRWLDTTKLGEFVKLVVSSVENK